MTNNNHMEFAKISGTDLTVSRIALGTWAIGGWMWGGSDEAQSIKTIRGAIEREIPLIDTAPVYGFGRSEEIVGKALTDGGLRKRVVIATKAGLDWSDGQPFRNAGRARIFVEVEHSLRRLRPDYIDIYQVHWPDPLTPIEECAEAMLALYRQGKIRAIGVSNFSHRQMHDFREVAPIHTVRPPTISSSASRIRKCCSAVLLERSVPPGAKSFTRSDSASERWHIDCSNF
jgi:aryl-alcohol dehydrogenase-like predicted oxidoreductase